MRRSAKTRHLFRTVDDVRLHVREAGVPGTTAMVFFHGFPNSSYYFRDVVPAVGEHLYAVAPDLPGSGLTESPPPGDFSYTYEGQLRVVEELLDSLGIERYVLYVTDYGTPVGYLLALRRPERVLGIVVQNGNTHDAGLGPAWDSARRYWADPTEENRAAVPDWLNFEGVRDEYLSAQSEEIQQLYARESIQYDWERLSQPHRTEIQFGLFADYGSHVARFPEIADYHRTYQPPCLVLWGRHDVYFDIHEVLAYSDEMSTMDAHIFDSGHLLLETHSPEVASLLVAFIRDVLTQS